MDEEVKDLNESTDKTYSLTFNLADLLLDYSSQFLKNGEKPNILTLPFLAKKGFSRDEILKFFFDLEEKGFAQYIPGRIGKGHCATIVVKDDYPVTHTITMTVKRISKRVEKSTKIVLKDSIEVHETTKPKKEPKRQPKPNKVDRSPSEDIAIPTLAGESFKPIDRKPIKAVPKKELGFGYVCTFSPGFVYLDHVNHAGYDTPLEAVENVWEELEGKFPVFKSRIMSDPEQAESILLGRGYLKLEAQ